MVAEALASVLAGGSSAPQGFPLPDSAGGVGARCFGIRLHCLFREESLGCHHCCAVGGAAHESWAPQRGTLATRIRVDPTPPGIALGYWVGRGSGSHSRGHARR